MGIKINSENLLPKWLNFSFIIIPLFILIGLISSSNTQECGERGMLNVDRKSQEAVNCDGSPYEGRGCCNKHNKLYCTRSRSLCWCCCMCWLSRRWQHGGGVGQYLPVVRYILLSQHVHIHTKWIQLGSAGWQAEVGPTWR